MITKRFALTVCALTLGAVLSACGENSSGESTSAAASEGMSAGITADSGNAKKLFETSADYQKGVRQTAKTDARHFKSCSCYVTRDYVVSYQDVLEVFRIDQIAEMYGYDKQRYHAILSFVFGAFAGFSMEHYLVAITADGEAHQFARLNAAVKVHSQIAGAILLKNQSIVLGRMNLALSAAGQTPDDHNLAKVKGFYGSTDIWKGRSLNSIGIE